MSLFTCSNDICSLSLHPLVEVQQVLDDTGYQFADSAMQVSFPASVGDVEPASFFRKIFVKFVNSSSRKREIKRYNSEEAMSLAFPSSDAASSHGTAAHISKSSEIEIGVESRAARNRYLNPMSMTPQVVYQVSESCVE